VFGTYFDYICTYDKDVYTKLYFGNLLYYIDKDSSAIWTYNPYQNERSPIYGSFDGNIVELSFLFDAFQLKKHLFSKNNVAPIDTVIDGKEYLLVKTLHPNDGDYTQRTDQIFINKSTFWIEKFSYYAKYIDQEQIQIFEYSNIEPVSFNINQKQAFIDSLEKVGYAIRKYERPVRPKLNIGADVLPFLALQYPANDSVFIPEKGKITILDFWYTSCMPCAKSIPDLNKVYEKYKSQIQVYGVNPFPEDMEKPEKVTAFLKRTPINYPIVVANGDDDLGHLKISGFPTIYVVDENGKLVFQKMGYNENEDMVQILDEVLQHCLKKRQ